MPSREILKVLEQHVELMEGECSCGFATCYPAHKAAMLEPVIERLLAAERAPMECGHPKACWMPQMISCPGPIPHEPEEFCECCESRCLACAQLKAEREKAREMCAVVASDPYIDEIKAHPDDPPSMVGEKIAKAIRQLKLTAPSSAEEGKK